MDISRYEKTIKQSFLFSETGSDELAGLIQSLGGTVRSYRKGEFLHSVGKTLRRFGLVLEGSVYVLSDDLNGERTIMATVSPGETFGESLCFLKVRQSPVYIEASEDATVLWLSADNIMNSVLSERFTAMLARRTLLMNDRIQILSKITLREKLITYFSGLVRQQKSKTFTVPMNREDMATYIGTNRSALSRELSKMRAEGLIDFYKNSFRILKN